MKTSQSDTRNTTAMRQEASSAKQTEPARGTFEWFAMIERQDAEHMEATTRGRQAKAKGA
jgi:hypothetical protein